MSRLLTTLLFIVALSSGVLGLGTSCTKALGSGTSKAGSPFWMQSIKHQGISAYNPDNSTYKVFRNVKDFGAKGDGVTDDTAAINNAIAEGSRCGYGNCSTSTMTPAVVFFPSGTYVVSSPLIAFYYTQMIGDAKSPPTLHARHNFSGIAVIDADPYIPNDNGNQWYYNTNNMFRSVRNFIIDLRQIPATTSATGFHWQAAQATSLINIVVTMSTAPGNIHQGMYMENGSGGYMGDLVFLGGKYGLYVGNQQFTVRNITVKNANTAVYGVWDWGWTFQGVNITNCTVGFDLNTASGNVGAEAIIDATVTNTPIFVRSSTTSSSSNPRSLVLNNIKLINVPVAVGVVGGATVLKGGTTTISSWGQGNVYTGTSGTPKFTQGSITAPSKPTSLLASTGQIFSKAHPQYETYDVSQFVSVRDEGATGDGVTDDTDAIKAIFKKYANCKIIFFDAGTYVVSSTISIPSGTRIVGEAWSVIAGTGGLFEDQSNPAPVVKVGSAGSSGPLEITDMIFSTIGPTAGAIVVEWNVHESYQGSAGMWDSHIRLGGTAETIASVPNCTRSREASDECAIAFIGLHLTPTSSAYFEGTWVWLADHDMDNETTTAQVYSGRGIFSESAGPTWFIGTASEHHTMYQYGLNGAKNHYMGLIQTETPYFQPTPAAPAPFVTNPTFNDPVFTANITSAWGLFVQNSNSIVVFGAGHYSFFQYYNQGCYSSQTCQNQIVSIDSASTVQLYSLTTVGTTYQLSVGGKAVVNGSNNLESKGQQSSMTFWGPASSKKRALDHHRHQKRLSVDF